MKKVLLCIAIVTLASGVAVAATSAGSVSPPQVFDLLEVNGPQHGLNGFHFQRPPRAGDQTAQTDALYEWTNGARGARIGRVELIITSKTDVSRNGTVGLVVAQVFLPAGSLFAEGYARFGGSQTPSTFPILGGTGAYATARGSVTSRALGGDKTRLQFHLVL
jgi:hypothetical protein